MNKAVSFFFLQLSCFSSKLEYQSTCFWVRESVFLLFSFTSCLSNSSNFSASPSNSLVLELLNYFFLSFRSLFSDLFCCGKLLSK